MQKITAGTTQRIKKYILHITGKEDNLPLLTGPSELASPEHVAYVPAEGSRGSYFESTRWKRGGGNTQWQSKETKPRGGCVLVCWGNCIKVMQTEHPNNEFTILLL